MRARTLHTDGEQRTVAIVLSTGDEAMACLKAFAEREHVTAAQFTAIGAFAGATLGYFDWTTKEYRRNAVDEQVEITSRNLMCPVRSLNGTGDCGHLLIYDPPPAAAHLEPVVLVRRCGRRPCRFCRSK